MAFEPKTGHKMKMYRNTGTVAVPVWSEVAEVGDVSISDLTRLLAELKRRANGFTKNLASLIGSIAVEFRLHFGLDSVQYTAIRQAFFAGTVAEWAIMSGDITVSTEEGLRCPFIIEQFPFDQALESAGGHDVRLAVAYMKEGATEVDPSWMVIA
jgi:hypothetical protein